MAILGEKSANEVLSDKELEEVCGGKIQFYVNLAKIGMASLYYDDPELGRKCYMVSLRCVEQVQTMLRWQDFTGEPDATVIQRMLDENLIMELDDSIIRDYDEWVH